MSVQQIVCLGLGLAACGSSTTMPDGATTGSLAVTVAAPAGTTPNVTVAGPAGYSMTLAATQTLTGLVPGAYTISADRVVIPGAIVSTIQDATVTGSPATVSVDQAATADVTFAQRPGTGHLWYADGSANTISALDASVLSATGTTTPSVGLGFGTEDPTAVTFDRAGNLWFALEATTSLARLGPDQLASTGTPTPVATIPTASPLYPFKLAFDSSANLWEGSLDSTVNATRYAAADVTGTGNLTVSPDTSLTDTAASGRSTYAIATDSAGNLWVAETIFSISGGAIHEFTTAQFGQATSMAPTKLLTSTSMIQPSALAFDAHGNLWVSDFALGGTPANLIRFDAAQLAGTGTSTTTALVITSSDLDDPNGIAFDEAGNLWVSNSSGGKLLQYPASELVGTGNQTLSASVVLTTGAALGGFAFDPSPAGLPLLR